MPPSVEATKEMRDEELFNKIVVEVRLITGLETSYVDHCNPGPIYTGEAFSGSAQ
jgi:hypothetical protein